MFLERCTDQSTSLDVFWYVRFITLDHHNYWIEYLMPSAVAPWPNAHVRGKARSEDEAIQMILTAMDRCGGWSTEVPR